MAEVDDLRKQLQSQKPVAIEEALSSLPPIQRLAFQTSLQQVKAKGPRGVRYTRVWIMNFLLLRIASPRAYNLLRNTKLLPLPTTSRLNQILSGVPCEYGFNEVALESIQAFFKDVRPIERCGTIVLDEIKLRESVDFNKSTLNFDGFVNIGGPSGEQFAADHALAIMFIPLFHAWVPPVASFATRGATPGFQLAKIVVESVLKLESYGATIIGVVSDGAGNNRSIWTHVGISGKLYQPVNKVPHPTLEGGRSLHFMCNVPHIVKCVRNHLLTPTYGKVMSALLFKKLLHLLK